MSTIELVNICNTPHCENEATEYRSCGWICKPCLDKMLAADAVWADNYTNLNTLSKYKIRGDWTNIEILNQWKSLKEKFPNTKLTFEAWLVGYGKVLF